MQELKGQSSVRFKSAIYFGPIYAFKKLKFHLKTIKRQTTNSTSLPNAEILKSIIKRNF